jgi:hypothetical protein
MDAVRELIYNGTIADEPGNRKGCVNIGLFDKVEVNQYIFPVLHAEIGLGNFLLELFFEWVDFKIEEMSEEEREKKNDFEVVVSEMEATMKRVDKWDVRNSCELNTLKVDVGKYINYRGRRHEGTNTFMLPLDERKQIDEHVKRMKNRINVLKKEKANISKDMKLKWRIYNEMKNKLDEYRKTREEG